MQSLSKRTDEGANDAVTSFKAALRLDSTYGAAWAGLAQTYQQAAARRFMFSRGSGDSILRLAITAADRAVALDGRDPEFLYTQAMVSRLVDPTDFAPAIRALRTAVAIDSGTPRYWQLLASTLYDVGERDEAFRDWRRSVGLDPLYTEGLSFLALGFMWSRQYDSAAHWADSAIAVSPEYLLARQARGYIAVERGKFEQAAGDFQAAQRLSTGVEAPNALAGRALVAARAGRKSEAQRLLARVESLMVPFTPPPVHNAVYNAAAYAALGNHSRAVDWLERVPVRADRHFQLHLRCDPALDPIARDPRFRALLMVPRPDPNRGC